MVQTKAAKDTKFDKGSHYLWVTLGPAPYLRWAPGTSLPDMVVIHSEEEPYVQRPPVLVSLLSL